MTTASLKKNNDYLYDNPFISVMTNLFGNTNMMYQGVKLAANAAKIAQLVTGPNGVLSDVYAFSKTGCSFLGWYYLPASFGFAVEGVKDLVAEPTSVRLWLESGRKTADFVSTTFYTVGPLCMKAMSGAGGVGAGFVKDTLEAAVLVTGLVMMKEPEAPSEQPENPCPLHQPPTAEQLYNNFQETRTLNILRLTKAVVSAVAGVFGVLALMGILTLNPIVGVSLLGIACTTAILSITAHFYEKCMEHKPQTVLY